MMRLRYLIWWLYKFYLEFYSLRCFAGLSISGGPGLIGCGSNNFPVSEVPPRVFAALHWAKRMRAGASKGF
tara:strand:- start:250 stop:462 length:213 start_codon:yes stop_codon:yes gene_type:complete